MAEAWAHGADVNWSNSEGKQSNTTYSGCIRGKEFVNSGFQW